jgi:hypothetical protein
MTAVSCLCVTNLPLCQKITNCVVSVIACVSTHCVSLVYYSVALVLTCVPVRQCTCTWGKRAVNCVCQTTHKIQVVPASGSLDTTGAPALPHNSAGARAFIKQGASQRASAWWQALLQSAVAAKTQQAGRCSCRAPWQPGHSRRAGAHAEPLRQGQQQPEHNSLGLTPGSASRKPPLTVHNSNWHHRVQFPGSVLTPPGAWQGCRTKTTPLISSINKIPTELPPPPPGI